MIRIDPKRFLGDAKSCDETGSQHIVRDSEESVVGSAGS